MIPELAQKSLAFQRGFLVFVVGLVLMALVAAVGLWRDVQRERAQEDVARRVFRNNFYPLVIQLGLRAMDLFFYKVLVGLLVDQGDVGRYDEAALLVTLILGTIADWGLTVWLTRELARDPLALNRLFGTTLIVRLGLAFLALPLITLLVLGDNQLHRAGLIANPLTGQTILLIGVLALTLLPGAFAAAATAVFLANEQPTTPALANLLNNSVSTLLRIALVVWGFGIIGVAWGALAATVANAFVFAWLLVRRWGWPGWSWDGRLARTMLRSSFPLMLNALLVAVFFRFDVFIIRSVHGSAAVADYTAAYRFANLALVLPPIVINALFPIFARQALDDRGALLRGYQLTLRVLWLLAVPLAAVLAVFAPEAIRLLAQEEFVAAGAPALAILIWFVPLSYTNGVAQYALIALGRQKAITVAFGVTALFNLLANLLTVPLLGINAAAAVTVLSEGVLYLPLAMLLRRELGGAPFLAVAWRPCVGAVGAVTAMLALRSQPVLALLVGSMIYSLVLGLLRTVTAEDRQLALRIWGKRRSDRVEVEAR